MDTNTQIGDIVASDYRSASVFRKYGIDFCCGGGKTLEAACENKEINADQLLSDLRAIEKDATPSESYKDWTLSRLIDHIVNKHHSYTRKTIDELDQYLTKVEKVHGSHNPNLKDILKNFEMLAEELSNHMPKEEMILFPYIIEMEKSKEKGLKLPPSPFGTVQNPIQMMENEHEMAGNCMKEIRRLSHDYQLPDHACNTYTVSFKLLEEFEKDLHEHIHLENNILFPKAIELENEK
jgi:regulator of cell morphogenesis and NO signaling